MPLRGKVLEVASFTRLNRFLDRARDYLQFRQNSGGLICGGRHVGGLMTGSSALRVNYCPDGPTTSKFYPKTFSWMVTQNFPWPQTTRRREPVKYLRRYIQCIEKRQFENVWALIIRARFVNANTFLSPVSWVPRIQ